jgi:ferric-dicitrate binding protein FerR (iron transport regulator)
MMQKKNIKNFESQVLLKYLRGAKADEAKDTIQRWLDDSGTEHELYDESLKFWDGIALDQKIAEGYKEDSILDKIHHNIKIEEGTFLNKNKSKVSFIHYLSRIAAVLFIPLLVASLLLLFQVESFKSEKSWAEIHAPYGTRTDFHLPDGSTGHLNGGSTIIFPVRFTGKIRNIKLTGEAYFNVVSNHKRPFIVSTERIDVKATGTSFNVMAYPDEAITEVTLLNGKVEVLRKKENVIASMGVLKPDESLIYNAKSDSRKIQSGNSADKLSWVDGKLIFKYEPFDEVIRKLNRWYNVNIEIKDTLLESYIYYGAFQDETLDEVLKLLQYTAPIKYQDIERKRKQDGTFEKRGIEIYYSKN